MASPKSVNILLATENDIPGIVAFLETPVIDQSFIYPLSQRMVSIEERVRSKLSQGFWLIVLHRSEIVGCRGCNGLIDKENKVVEFSTVAINSAFRGSGLGMFLVRKAVEIAFERYSPQKMKFDSWSTNKVIEQIALRVGFSKSRSYDDPLKRPPCIQSVEYVLDCSTLTQRSSLSDGRP